MGQDREFNEEEKKLALRTVRQYKEKQEQIEKENLREDIICTVERMHQDKEYKELHEALDAQALEKLIEEHFIPKEGEDPIDEETKQVLARKLRFNILTRQFYVHHEFPHNGKPVLQGHSENHHAPVH